MAELAEEYCYLTVLSGPRAGTNFMLSSRQPNRAGRSSECDIVIKDESCSRVHALILRTEDAWEVHDEGSRNGSFLNGIRIEKAVLDDGVELKLGDVRFAFHKTTEPPTMTASRGKAENQTVMQEALVDADDSERRLLMALENAEFAHDLLIIYQLSVKLLELNEPDRVIHISLDLLHDRTKAAAVGFLWATEDGQLRPKLVLPDQDEDITLSEPLTNVVCEQGRAIWISNHSDRSQLAPKLKRYSDAICVPLVKNRVTLGVIHLYLKQGRFRQADFDFAISVANLMAVSLVRTRLDMALKADHQRLVDQLAGFNALVGDSQAMRDLKAVIVKVAQTRGSVLVRGESGSGKELVARALHAASPRNDRPLLSVNCAAISSDLIESHLFGHKKGAFTSADRDHNGWFQQADTGTLFLDEIGELPMSGQAKLLRILEGHSFQPVGGTEELTVDVRVIAATNRDLKELVRQKRFRQDLYFRLSVFDIELPPLRERGDDILQLAEHFFEHYRKLHGRPHLRLSQAARDRLRSYEWPGNIRQLRNVIDSAVVLADGATIESHDLGIQSVPIGDRPTSLRIADWEKILIQDALVKSRGKVPEAARLLGIGRATLYRKLDEYGIDRDVP